MRIRRKLRMHGVLGFWVHIFLVLKMIIIKRGFGGAQFGLTKKKKGSLGNLAPH